ncbi:NmrA family NAD(P)-binding protein [Brumimicrobium oceani]|uniref:NmrA-like family protein n=1 Tax=Brumimicrobium oceani TaxID=2100725 RepID=A0A2U2X566_9FLAO|nr:NmrA family NAD(P)-binding protein [Brumimicrobium oceani]PWH82935.1 NmrA-like family protein [Brumimicrobium oceani]
MNRVLLTGATGNVGEEVLRHLYTYSNKCEIVAGVRDVNRAKSKLAILESIAFRKFDFEDSATFVSAFQEIDILFLLRPPHISEVEKYFKPLLEAAKKAGINKIVFLSVQGAEKSKVIPHNKIERLIQSLDFEYIFVRPSYFMQNLTTSLISEIQEKRTITLPSGKAKFNWIDVKDIGKATAVLLSSFDSHRNLAYEITGSENLDFYQASELISKEIGSEINFKSINPIRFYFKKKKEGIESAFAIVMTILHFLPRLQKEPEISDNFKKLTGSKPTILKEFVERNRALFLG